MSFPRRLSILAAVALAAPLASGQHAVIPLSEAKTVVQVVMQYEKINPSDPQCSLKSLDGGRQWPFVPHYYSFWLSCDYPDAMERNVRELYVVSPRTGDIWEYDRCEHYDFPALRQLQQEITQKTKATKADEARYVEFVGCKTGVQKRRMFIIPNEQTAVGVALVVFKTVFRQEQINKFLPYHAQLNGDVWTVYGTIKQGTRGGTPQLRISAKDGKVLQIWHSR